jgi:MFS family permease
MALNFRGGALRHRDFAIFFAGQLVSLVGSWMQSVGQSWLILQMTNSPLKLGLITTLQFLPMLLFALFAGAVIDRVPKKKLIIVTQTIFMILAFVLSALVWTKTVQYWHVAVLALLLGIFNTLDMPARQSYIVEMVGKEDLGSAVAINSAAFNGARIIGPAIAGLLIGAYGIAPAFLLNGISFIAVIGALFTIKAEGLPKPGSHKVPMVTQVGQGLQYAWRTPMVKLLLGCLLAIGLFVINWSVMIPLLAKQVLHQEAGGYGVLMAVMGAGSLIGALLLAANGRKQPTLNLITSMGLALCVSTMTVFLIHSFWVACVAIFIMGFTMIQFLTGINTNLQLSAPDELRGRVMSLYVLANAGVTPLGSIFVGTVAEGWGPSSSFLAAGGAGLVALLALLAWWYTRAKQTGLQPQENA